MQILYLAQQYDYGDTARGYSFEHYNFYHALCAMGHELIYFDYPSEITKFGRTAANRRLESIVRSDKPEVLFGVVRDNAIDKNTIRRISDDTDTVTINWFCDDHWQFDTIGREWTPHFNYVVTTSQDALAKYEAYGMKNVIKSQWGANHTLYKPTPGPKQYDVTFVGQPYGIRGQAIEALKQAGVRVNAWGSGWPLGKLDQAEMIRVFGQSRINLNFADASSSGRTIIQRIANSHQVRSLRDKPGLWRAWDWSQRLARWDKRRSDRKSPPPRQIKGRVFEVPACGGVLLTQSAENLEAYLSLGTECLCFDGIDSLIETVRYYLKHSEERQAIARQGYERVLAEHTFERRFEDIFNQAGFNPSHRVVSPLVRETAKTVKAA